MSLRLAIVGSRTYKDEEKIKQTLERYKDDDLVVVSGGQPKGVARPEPKRSLGRFPKG